MLLQALVDYYEILAQDEACNIPKPGYGTAKVSFVLTLSPQGELVDVVSIKRPNAKGNKLIAPNMVVPQPVDRSSGIKSNFLCDNSSYVLGFDNKGKPKRSKGCFQSFLELHEQILAGVDNAQANAVLLFLQSWEPERAKEHPLLEPYLEDIYSGANFIFRLDGELAYVHENIEIKKAWEKYKQEQAEESVKGPCLVTGQNALIARLHSSLKGIRGGQAMGNSLVSFNAPAYESYGNNDAQGLNAPVSEYAMFAYTTALNHLLSDDEHKLFLGDMTLVFWAQSKQSVFFQDIISCMIEPEELDSDKRRFQRDEAATQRVSSFFGKLAQGKKVTAVSGMDESVHFCVLGLSPNAARISVRFFLQDNFGAFAQRLEQHYSNLSIEKQHVKDKDSISIWRVLNETVAPSSTNKSASPLLAGALMRAILSGQPYPSALFQSIMMRIRAEKDINYYKAAIIKAYLLRSSFCYKYKEVLTMSLNADSRCKPYVLGRLFAVLEKAQLDASPGLKATIKDRYFTSACANPANTFPILLRLSNHHNAKAEYGKNNERKIEEIMQLLNVEESPFPKTLSLEDQGVFVLGYYHQKNAFFKKTEVKEDE